MLNEAKAWNLPQAEIILQATYNLFDKFLVKAGLDMSFGRYAKVYAAGTNIIELNNQFVYDLGNVIDGNLTLEYRYNKRISGFVQLNNIASQRYLRFYNYPVMPISVFGGLTIKF
jgi:outer membrane receptor protein involved in Fe transport